MDLSDAVWSRDWDMKGNREHSTNGRGKS